MHTTPRPWGAQEKAEWLSAQTLQRSYQQDVCHPIQQLSSTWVIERYGALSYNPNRYPLFVLKTLNWQADRPSVLVTGGVHGYETSGVMGAIRFAEQHASTYDAHVNFAIVPCVSPWSYESINRWTFTTDDPNRSFIDDGHTEESAALIRMLRSLSHPLTAHIDLHETTDTDNSVFRPAKAARDGIEQAVWDIPDGFYLVGDAENPQPALQKAVIDSVKKVTAIAPADKNGKIIGEPLQQEGVIHYDYNALGLCGGVTGCEFTTTTEVYPDSPKATPELCIDAQVAAIKGLLAFLMGRQ